MNLSSRLPWAVTASAVLALCIGRADATGRILIDFQGPDGVANSGQSFVGPFDPTYAANCASGLGPASCILHLNTDLTSGPINLGFNVAIGGVSYSSLYINENGIVTFGTPIASGTPVLPTTTTLAALQGLYSQPFIAASYAPLNTAGTSTDDFSLDDGAVMYQRGAASLNESQTGTLLPSMSIVWNDPSLFGIANDDFSAQLVIYSLDSSGDFAFRFRDGSDEFGANAAIGQIIGYSLGSVSGSYAGPLDPDVDYLVTSSGGGNPTPVPEPSTTALFAVAVIVLTVAARRRRVTPSLGRLRCATAEPR